MPSFQRIHEATTGFTFEIGDEKINLRAYLERIGTPEYQELEDEHAELSDQLRLLIQKMQDELARLTGLKKPSDEQYLDFRQFFEETLTQLKKAFGDESDDLLEDPTPEAIVQAASKRLEDFNDLILPSESEVETRQQDVQAALKAIRGEINGINELIKANRVRRLVMLLQSWDITESDDEGSKMWDISEANLLTFSAPLIKELLEAAEKKVTGRSLIQ